MNIEPGTRVRSTEAEYPDLDQGTYVGMWKNYYEIQWDSTEYPFVHYREEFEVIA